jgi:hypothetical protein
MMAMPIAEIYALLLAGLLAVGVLWLVARFNDRDWPGLEATST